MPKRSVLNIHVLGVDAIHIEEALAHPQCVTVLTAKDVPFNKTGHIVPDWDVMIAEGDITRYVGDAIAVVAVKEKNICKKYVIW